jgi:signal transduction histidine kinase
VSLTTRLLVFFQAALAVVLVAFCAALYAAASWYVHHQADDATERAAATLVASVDIEADSVEWEPSDRDVAPGPGPLGDAVHWFITDARGSPVDRSAGTEAADLLAAAGTGTDLPTAPDGWLVTRRLVHPPNATGTQLTRDRTAEEVEKGEYPALVFTTGVRTGPLRAALNALAAGLAAVSLAIWLVAIGVGRWVCRKALRPVTDMAAAASRMRAEDAGDRLPPPGARGELDALHAAISGLVDRLRAAIGRERRFTAEASHQLRTPLATILGQVEVALRRPRPPEEYERVLGVVRRQAGDLSGCVEALLFLARADADAPPPSAEPIDLRAWVPELLDSFAAHPRRADLAFDPGTGPAVVAAHPPLLRQLVGNLIDNALKYSPAGSPVAVRLGRDDPGVKLVVEDCGPGIAPADVGHLFEPFFRGGDATRMGVTGTGLGLAVAARIAAAFGGRIDVSSRAGEGSRFVVTLPAATPTRVDEENFIPASRVS